MKLSIENNTVVCSLENKNSEFLSACAGEFDGYLNGKLKVFWYDPSEFKDPDYARECNIARFKAVLSNALEYGIEIDESVNEYNAAMRSAAEEIRQRRAIKAKEAELKKDWERLCQNGCGSCKNLFYEIDIPKCKKTGATLEEKNVQKYIDGVLQLFNFEPFPAENCPFNIKNKEYINECLSEACSGTSKA